MSVGRYQIIISLSHTHAQDPGEIQDMRPNRWIRPGCDLESGALGEGTWRAWRGVVVGDVAVGIIAVEVISVGDIVGQWGGKFPLPPTNLTLDKTGENLHKQRPLSLTYSNS